jgi:hypothetical protein
MYDILIDINFSNLEICQSKKKPTIRRFCNRLSCDTR